MTIKPTHLRIIVPSDGTDETPAAVNPNQPTGQERQADTFEAVSNDHVIINIPQSPKAAAGSVIQSMTEVLADLRDIRSKVGDLPDVDTALARREELATSIIDSERAISELVSKAQMYSAFLDDLLSVLSQLNIPHTPPNTPTHATEPTNQS